MRITSIPWAILRWQYRAARLPVGLFERRVLDRLNSDSPTRLAYERVIGAVDAMAGRVLGDRDLQARGVAHVEHAEAFEQAVRLDEIAARRMQQADAELLRKHEAAAAAPEDAHKAAQDWVDQALTVAEQRRQRATQTANDRTAAAEAKVDRAAQQRSAEVDERERGTEDRSRAAEKSVTDAAEAELDDAAGTRAAATGARAHADRLGELSDAKQQKRRAERTGQS